MIIEPQKHPFCENIRYLRRKYALSRRAFCNLMGISEAKLESWEKEWGPVNLSYTTSLRICAVFGITTDDLFGKQLESPKK